MLYQNYDINNIDDLKKIEKIGNALSSIIRLKILSQISNTQISIMDLAKLNYVSVSSIVFHLNILIDAGLACITTINTNHGVKRFASRSCATVNIKLFSEFIPENENKNILNLSV